MSLLHEFYNFRCDFDDITNAYLIFYYVTVMQGHIGLHSITSAKYIQGWEFSHQFFERLARFLGVKERKSDSLMKRAKRSRRSFVMSDLSESLN